MKILSVDQIREADQFTIQNEPISSVDLMERAANRAAEWIIAHFPEKESSFDIFCGIGNNGGDGAVISRLLKEAGYKVNTYVLEISSKFSTDLKINLERLSDYQTLSDGKADFELQENSVVIDAIFGSGLSRGVEGFSADIIDKLNDSGHLIISIDIPSGLFADKSSAKGSIIKATHCLSFQFPKLAFFMPQNLAYVRDWSIIDIGLHLDYILSAKTTHYYLTKEDARSMLKERKTFSHKGDHGRAVLIAGSKGKMGAAVLASKACMRTGAGLLTVQVPACGYEIMQTSVPEAMVEVDEAEDVISEIKMDLKYDAIGIGPGLGMSDETQNFFKQLIQLSSSPMLIDADALNIISENKTWLSFLPIGCIITPHLGEFKRLVGYWSDDFERLELQKDFALKYGQYVVLKGKFTSIACPDGRIYFNPTGNAGMATAGSGDVLSGMITSLLAQGYASEQAALLGVYLHGLAGDIAADLYGERSMIAGDIVEAISQAYFEIES
ncbi:MAG: bifunctional ADP-dependent NAD(P)H-hydrate dehydratase/NAD(P)H-hydrate epimerase [Flavobacteriales bacterium]|nr:bifunctional ADP-dependent NAD(P)H-hydrate dehydratase/NAD(P)H-hydrate epimerase [Flavobacteriales bacterium]